MALNDPEFNKNKVTLDFIETEKAENFILKGDNKPIEQDNESSIIKADHFTATKRINIFLTSILFIGLIYLINRFKQ